MIFIANLRCWVEKAGTLLCAFEGGQGIYYTKELFKLQS